MDIKQQIGELKATSSSMEKKFDDHAEKTEDSLADTKKRVAELENFNTGLKAKAGIVAGIVSFAITIGIKYITKLFD